YLLPVLSGDCCIGEWGDGGGRGEAEDSSGFHTLALSEPEQLACPEGAGNSEEAYEWKAPVPGDQQRQREGDCGEGHAPHQVAPCGLPTRIHQTGTRPKRRSRR